MPKGKVFITGVGGLVGSTTARYFARKNWKVWGVENDARKALFGEQGSVTPTINALDKHANVTVHIGDIRDHRTMLQMLKAFKPDAIIHTAGQPSHDYSMKHPFVDLSLNAEGTLSMLEATRKAGGNIPFVFTSTNKVYGNVPGNMHYVETETRWVPEDWYTAKHGFDEALPLEGYTHSLFGVSKVAADLMVQEYALYYGMPTVCFRCGCITGHAHQGVELHGFLSYLYKCVKTGTLYTIFGHKGKQVRDNIHAWDLAAAFHAWIENPKSGVYNMGGGPNNSTSVLEAIHQFERMTGREANTAYSEIARKGDHIWWISDTSRFEWEYPTWARQYSLGDILMDLAS